MSSVADGPGAVLVGAMLVAFLGGLASALGFIYFQTFPNDRLIFRALAGLILTLTYTVMTTGSYYAWEVCIVHFGDAEYLLVESWAVVCSLPVGAVSGACVQLFLVYRAWILSGRTHKAWNALLVVTLVVSLAALALAISITAWLAKQTSPGSMLRQTSALYWWYGIQTTGEALVTGSLIYMVILSPHHQPTPTTRVGIVQRFALRATETNLISVIAQIVIIVLITNSTNLGMWFTAIAFSMPALYAISLLLALLSRASEEATFKFEAENAPIVIRARGVNSNPVGSQVNVQVRNVIRVDSPSFATLEWTDQVSGQPLNIQFGGQHWPAELDKEEEHEMDTV